MIEKPAKCKNGHAITASNTYVNPKTKKKNCRPCRRESSYKLRVREIKIERKAKEMLSRVEAV